MYTSETHTLVWNDQKYSLLLITLQNKIGFKAAPQSSTHATFGFSSFLLNEHKLARGWRNLTS